MTPTISNAAVLAANFSRSTATYDEAAALARETGKRMFERLEYTRLAPKYVADIGCATGDGVRALQKRFPGALALAIDYARPMLEAVRERTPRLQRILGRGPRLLNADVNALPLAARSLGLVWSNLMLQWLDDPLPAIRELHRVLEVDGLLMFATLGPDTLRELRMAAKIVGADNTARNFLDMHDLGDMLVAAGFSDPVMDMEMIALTYESARGFLADQRHLGVRNALLGHLDWRQWRKLFAAWPRDAENRLPVSFEIVFGQAWKIPPTKTADGHPIVQLHRRDPRQPMR